jgi:hypothetical protein
LRTVLEALRAEFSDLVRLSDILAMTRSKAIPRSGAIAGDLEYQVHGRGILIIDAIGREVDFDFLPDGSAIFDAWRVLRFSSRAAESATAIDAECRRLVSENLLVEPVPGWFSTPA